jgi:hypothetical protein
MTTLNTFTCNLDITICLYSMLGVDRTQQADLQIVQVVHLVNHLCWGRLLRFAKRGPTWTRIMWMQPLVTQL